MGFKKYLQNAFETFETISRMIQKRKIRKLGPKYKFLPQWLQRQSELYLNEINTEKEERKYWTFKRGSLVFVEFGVNIGGELSNNHWAIVLDKKDSPYKKSLTVVPISSKQTGKFVPISETVSEGPFKIIEKYLQDLSLKLYCIQRYYLEHYPDFTLDEQQAAAHKEWDSLYSNIYNPESEEYASYDTLLELSSKFILVQELADYYQKYISTSYAKVSNIQTISKDRILIKNELDPIGQFQVSNETLDNIDQAIKELFIVK